MAKTDKEKLAALKERKKHLEALNISGDAIKTAKAQTATLKSETQKEPE